MFVHEISKLYWEIEQWRLGKANLLVELINYVYLQNKYGREDFQKITSVELKKNNDKNNIKMWRTVLRSYLSTDLLFY